MIVRMMVSAGGLPAMAAVLVIALATACAPGAPVDDQAVADPPASSASAVRPRTPTPTPTPTAPALARPGTTCGPIGHGLIAIVARGEVACSTAKTIMKKFVGADNTEVGRTVDVDGWGCSILDGSLPETASIYTFAYECAAKKNLIKAWPADSPVPPGSQVDVKHYAGEYTEGGFPYYFSIPGGAFTCGILPPTDDGPGSVTCRGELPEEAEARAPRGKGQVAANSVLLDRDRKARFAISGDPPDLKIKELPIGQVLAFYGVACATGPEETVRCINGEHEVALRPGAAELS